MSQAADDSAARLQVTAVVVAHDGATWLPRVLAAVSASTRTPDDIIAVDTGSHDASVSRLTEALGAHRVVEVDRDTGFGAAVTAGLAAADGSRQADPSDSRPRERGRDDEWVWLLHDDCAPEPDALQLLLEVAASDPRIAAVGCRLRAWPRATRLLEVGVTITGTGHRETGLEPGEYDQGQHDDERDVLAVSSAGMLVRRTTWDALGGLDPLLPLFRDDVDFGWRAAAAGHRVVVAPQALVFHVEAASRGLREISSTVSRPHQADRRAAILTVLANCRLPALPFLYARFLGGSLLRALGYLLGKVPGAAWDEVAATARVLGTPWVLVGARRRRRGSRPAGGPAAVRRLLPPWWRPYAHGLEAVLSAGTEVFRGTAGSVVASRLRSRSGDPTALETGPVPDEAVNLPTGDGVRAALARHPLLAVVTVLTLASLVASRGLWGGGFLHGGALLPAPGGVGGWWQLYGQSWHPVGMGSTLDAAPYVALLALPGTVLLGKAWLVVDLVMLFCAPLAGAGAWVASGRMVRGIGPRVWVAVAYGLVPILVGAVTTGHLGTVVVAILLPWVARSGCRILDLDRPPRWNTAWAAGLTLSIATAFAPVCWPIALGLVVVAVGWLAAERQLLRSCQLLVALTVPVALLLPWSWRVISTPGLALTEAGAVDVPGASLDGSGWQLAFGRFGANGQAPWWIGAGLVVAALLALLRRDTRGRVVGAWVVIAGGMVAALVMWRDPVPLPLGAGQAYTWLGVPVVVASAGAIAAVGIAADGLADYVGSGSFGWRQPAAVLGLVAAVSVPLLGLGWWVGAAPHGDLGRAAAVPLPAYMVDAMRTDDQRVLLLHTGTPTVHYQVLAGDGLRLGDDSVLPPNPPPEIAGLVADLFSEGTAADVQRLGSLGIGYVVLPSPQSTAAAAQLDALPGLTRTSTDQSLISGWQVQAPLTKPGSSAGDAARDRWLVLQALMWLAVIVLAAPSVERKPLETPEAAT